LAACRGTASDQDSAGANAGISHGALSQAVALFLGAERRRQWCDEQKLVLIEIAFAPGAKATRTRRRRTSTEPDLSLAP
jgi:hypothetical protein